jgi:predicted amidohydrolase
MRIALAQYALDPEMKKNLSKVCQMMNAAARQDAQLICFPELCLSPFFPQFPGQDAGRYAMPIDHADLREIQLSCRSLSLVAAPNVYLDEKGSRFDASLLIDSQGAIVGVSKMVHIAQVPCFYEQDYYTPSDTGFNVYETPLGRIGIVVCFDRHYPESIRTCVLRGAQLILIPTANTMHEPRDLFEWELRVAAMQNGVYIAMCNRVGVEGAVTFCGDSVIVDPHGNVVAKADDKEVLLSAEIDLSEVEIARRNRPYLSLRRPTMYER